MIVEIVSAGSSTNTASRRENRICAHHTLLSYWENRTCWESIEIPANRMF